MQIYSNFLTWTLVFTLICVFGGPDGPQVLKNVIEMLTIDEPLGNLGLLFLFVGWLPAFSLLKIHHPDLALLMSVIMIL